MTQIKTVKGDLIALFKKGRFDIILHGCNCFKTLSYGTSGGIGHTIGKNFIQARLADEETYYADPRKLGSYSVGFSRVKDNKIGYILNCYVQFYPGKDFRYSELRRVLKKVNKHFKGKNIGMPLIGCGIGGGEWIKVFTIIRNILTDVNVTIVEFKNDQSNIRKLL